MGILMLFLLGGLNRFLPMFGASGGVPIVENFELNVSGTPSAWDIGDGTILEAWR